jgi:VIT1/CCC1 family predicted Fe2+/Mn2+ transporter
MVDQANKGKGSIFSRIKESLFSSAGDIVFGMEDGAVSIFGLVLGVAVGSQTAYAVFLAGATGAIAASVSMMAGLYLDLESERDEATVEEVLREKEITKDPNAAINGFMDHLKSSGLSQKSLESIREDVKADPLSIRKLENAIAADEEPPAYKSPVLVQVVWMGITDFTAGITPVIPFAILPFQQARILCITATALLLILLGVGRSIIGKRPMLRGVLETCSIAAAAAIAGVVIAYVISA